MTTNGDIPMNSGSEENAKNGGPEPEGQSGEPESPPTVQSSAGQSSEPESSLVVAVEEPLSASSNGQGKPLEALQTGM